MDYKDVWTDLLGSCLLQREHLTCNSGEGIVAVSFPSLPFRFPFAIFCGRDWGIGMDHAAGRT